MAVETPEATVEAPVPETKSEQAVVEVDAGLAAKIIRQVEYYFGDLNLSKDKFMQEEIQKEDGCKTLFFLCTARYL